MNNVDALFEAFASICRGSVYVIDFKEKRLRYVSNHELLLCGHSVDEVMRLGYDFYLRIVHPDDKSLLKKIFLEILKACRDTKHPNNLHCFSFTVRIKMYSQQEKQPDYLTAYLKMAPIFEDGQIRFGVCLLTCAETNITDSSDRDSGDLRLYYKDNERHDEYSFTNCKWKTYKIEHLTESEKIILIRAMCGESNRSLASKLCMSNSKLTHILTKLYKKLGVKTML